MKIFDELLLDADWSVNAGMWMWLSCSSFFQQFFHCYCPVKFGRKADPNGDFIRRYLPVLKNTPTRYIHEPWIAPVSVQKASRCVVGVDYPLPMVNHPVVSKINIERIKQVYRQLANYKGAKSGVPTHLQVPVTTACGPTKPKSPEAMSIETYASLVTPPSRLESPLPSPFTPPAVINTDVIQYPPCCPGDQYVEAYTISRAGKTTFNITNPASTGSANPASMANPRGQQGKGVSSMRGGKPMQTLPLGRGGNPMNTSRGKPMETSMGQSMKSIHSSLMSGKPLANTPMAEKQMHHSMSGGKPMNTSMSEPMQSMSGGKSGHTSSMGGKPIQPSPMGGKSMMMDTQVGGGPTKPSRQVTMDDQISDISGNNYLERNQSKVGNMQGDCPMPASNCSMEDVSGTLSPQDGNNMLTRDSCDDSNDASAALLSEIVGTIDEPPSETTGEGEDRLEYSSMMLNEESNVNRGRICSESVSR
uniref:Cryptochrome-1 n=1 Tax=Cacopsylla melanoneura TaxID=428564 RepID=A0A8D9EE45_9HEMI